MNYSRVHGFMWGTIFGACLVAGVLLHPAMLFAALIPLGGNYLYRNVV